MNYEEFLIQPEKIKCEKWQIGSMIGREISEGGVVLIWVSDRRGAGGDAEILDFNSLRRQFYRLSKLDFEVPVCDLGDLVSGKSVQDTHYILQEVISACLYRKSIPLIIGGSSDLAYSLFYTLNFHHQTINYTHISSAVSLDSNGEEINEQNFLAKIFSTKNFSINNFHLLGYQKHLNHDDILKIVKQVDFDVVRLAEMMGDTSLTEPYFRNADLVTLNCDAVESFAEPFSYRPQVNGLNRREICAYMKETGLGENLKCVGIFNFNFDIHSQLNNQLLAQMLWYLLEGINIQQSHPKDKNIETYWIMIDDQNFSFKRDTFSDLWYFGNDEDLNKCLPCSAAEYEDAKKGLLSLRLQKFVG